MMQYCAEKIVGWLIGCNAIKNEDRELYEYAVYSLFLWVVPLFFAVITGVCLGKVGQSIAVVVPFMMTRKFSGGVHAKYPWVCFICSCTLLGICTYLSGYLVYGWKMALITAAAVVLLGYFSPIEHENKKLNEDERKLYKKITVMITSISWCVAVALYLLDQGVFAVCISLGILLTAGLQWPVIIKRYLYLFKMPKT